jgi:parallel beta-helix repeat protein
MRGIAKARVSVVMLTMLVSLLAGTSLLPTASAAVLYVGGEGPGNYTTIQGAIDAASPGDTIYVYSGVYEESVSISKPLMLVGERAETTEISAVGQERAINVLASHVNVSGFTIGGSSSIGLFMGHAHHCTIADSVFHGDIRTIYLYHSDDNTIGGNTILKGLDGGIRLENSHGNTIEDNSVSEKEWGVLLIRSNGNAITGNHILKTYRGIKLYYSDDAEIVGNQVTGSGRYGMLLDESDGARIGSNVVSKSGDGILSIYSSTDILVTANLITDNEYGVYAENAHVGSMSILNNTILRNSIAGILLEGTKSNLIVGNTIGHNRDGIEIEDPMGKNIAHHNNFIQNSGDNGHACDDNSNGIWDDGYPSGGNYWDDYAGEDHFSGPNQDIPGPDGIGDTWRVVPPCEPACGDPFDRYPLMTVYAPLSPLVGMYDALQSYGVIVPLPPEYGLWGVENVTVNRTPPDRGGSRLFGSSGHEDRVPEPYVGVPVSTAFESRVSGTGSSGTSTQTPDCGAIWGRSNP